MLRAERRLGAGDAVAAHRSGRGSPCCASGLKGLPALVWDGTGENPYFAYLALADAFLVTADSVSMISEAAATGKPVHILDLAGGDAKFARFHAAMRQAGITRPFAGRIEYWSYALPDDTARAGAALRALCRREWRRRGRCATLVVADVRASLVEAIRSDERVTGRDRVSVGPCTRLTVRRA